LKVRSLKGTAREGKLASEWLWKPMVGFDYYNGAASQSTT